MPRENSPRGWEQGFQSYANLTIIFLLMTRIGALTAKMVLASAADMNAPTDPPPGLIPVPMKGATLLLTAAEFTAGVRRGKWWRRRAAMERREATSDPAPVVASGDPGRLL